MQVSPVTFRIWSEWSRIASFPCYFPYMIWRVPYCKFPLLLSVYDLKGPVYASFPCYFPVYDLNAIPDMQVSPVIFPYMIPYMIYDVYEIKSYIYIYKHHPISGLMNSQSPQWCIHLLCSFGWRLLSPTWGGHWVRLCCRWIFAKLWRVLHPDRCAQDLWHGYRWQRMLRKGVIDLVQLIFKSVICKLLARICGFHRPAGRCRIHSVAISNCILGFLGVISTVHRSRLPVLTRIWFDLRPSIWSLVQNRTIATLYAHMHAWVNMASAVQNYIYKTSRGIGRLDAVYNSLIMCGQWKEYTIDSIYINNYQDKIPWIQISLYNRLHVQQKNI